MQNNAINNHIKIATKKQPHEVALMICRQCSIFPGRYQPSIFDDEKLNFRVRDENGWTFSLWSPTMVYLKAKCFEISM